VCTYKRPELLAQLLVSLKDQDADTEFTYDVVVVDNDHLASAEKTVQDFTSRASIGVTYCVEPEQNIALARNKAVRNSRGEYVAFIDDDEIPSRSWLSKLHATLNRLHVDGVLGPVLPSYDVTAPKWVVKGKFYERPSHETGAVLHWTNTRTGNVLLRRTIFSDKENMFRPEFGRGGEDRDFFRRMIAKGMQFVWCAEAPVSEAVTAQRCTRSFMLRRALLRGQLPRFSGIDVLKSLIAIPLYTVSLPFLLIGAHHVFMKYLIKDCDHVGRICGFLGMRLIKDKYVIQ
jgi:glycosyltransferase involved in cell wall biosynthesis